MNDIGDELPNGPDLDANDMLTNGYKPQVVGQDKSEIDSAIELLEEIANTTLMLHGKVLKTYAPVILKRPEAPQEEIPTKMQSSLGVRIEGVSRILNRVNKGLEYMQKNSAV
jgi:hypothetical protein